MATEASPNTSPIAEIRAPAPAGWLRSPSFDFVFVGGAVLAALLATLTVVVEPRLFPLVLVIDMWLLGFHHVVSTFTRLTFDSESFCNHRFLVLGLPWIVLAGVGILVYTVGGSKFAYFKTSEPERWRFSVRVTPDRFVELTDIPGVKPARWRGRYGWITIVDVATFPAGYLKELIDASYRRAL